MRRFVWGPLAAGIALAGCEASLAEPEIEPDLGYVSDDDDDDDDDRDETRRYRVTVYNLTESQPFTPPLVATHNARARFFRVGRRASEGIKEIAENGNLAPLNDALSTNRNVSGIVIAAGDPPPLLQGESITFEIEGDEDHRFLSWVSMLICTNDGFTGRNRVRLPRRVGRERWAYARAYDAGTEINTEDFADIVPPCQIFGATSSDDAGTGMSNPDLKERRRIRRHRGIRGGNDLVPDLHGWRNPVAKVVIERIG